MLFSKFSFLVHFILRLTLSLLKFKIRILTHLLIELYNHVNHIWFAFNIFINKILNANNNDTHSKLKHLFYKDDKNSSF